MKRALHTICILAISFATAYTSYAQDTNKPFEPKKRYTPLPLVPTFPGGRDSLALFIKTHTRYPSSARKHGIKGVVQVVFFVTKEGKLTNIRVFKAIGYGCDKEALRVVKLMPKWNPGMMGRDPMEMDYHVDIPFGMEAPKQNHP